MLTAGSGAAGRNVIGLATAAVVVMGLAAGLPSARAAAAQVAAAGHRAGPLDLSVTDWPTFHGSPSLQGVSPDTAISDLNAGQLGLSWMSPTMAPMLSSPVTAYDAALGETLAYIGNNAGYVEAINVADGSLVWSDDFGEPIYATPSVYDGSVWVGTFVSGHMYKLDASTGAVECDVPLGTGSDLSSPTIATPPGGQPTVYFGVIDNGVISGPIMAVDEATCDVDWSVVPYSQESGSWNPTSFGVDADGEPLVFAGSADPDSTAYALDANTGAKVWSDQNHSPSYADVGAGITVSPPGNNGIADGMVYYPGKDRILYAIDMTTGSVAWTFNYGAATHSSSNGGRSAAALVGNELVFGTSVGVIAVNAITGTEIWNSQDTVGTDTEVLSSPLITGPPGDQVVVYGDLHGRLIVLSLATGEELYSFQTHGYIVGSPADSSGNILITSSDGFLYDFSLGGTNSASYPTTAIASPVTGSTVPYPGSAGVTAAGSASSANSCNGVLVAVQQDGPAGPWWNAATQSWQPALAWNQATLGSAGTCSGGWSFPVTVQPQGAVLEFFARATDADGEVDPVGATSTVIVSPAPNGPHLKLNAPLVAPGSSVSVSGGGFSPGEQVQISLPGAVLATATATAKGNLPSVRAKVPKGYPVGLSGITATGQTSGLAVTAPLYVTTSWPELGDNPARTAYQADTALSTQETPGRGYGLDPSAVYDTGAPVRSSAAVADLVAYIGNDAGDVDAVSTANGALLWQASTGGPVDSSPAIDPKAGLVVVGSGDDNVYAFNINTGATVWKTPTGAAVESSPAIADGVVYVGSDDGNLYALNEATGAVLWSAALTGTVTASPAVDSARGEVVVSDSAGDVTAFSAGGTAPGTMLWTYTTGGAAGTPLISAGTVYVGSADGHEYALAESTGAQQWATPLGGTPSPAALANGVLYVGTSADGLFGLTAASGAVDWQDKTPGAVTGIAVTSGFFYIECANGTVAGYRVKGLNVWLAQTGAGLSGTPAIVDNAVIIGAGDSNLYVYTPFGLPMI
jgi:outer membrane protein assembly factor BamB